MRRSGASAGRGGLNGMGATVLFLVAATLSGAEPDLRTGESAASSARPLGTLFQESAPEVFRKTVARIGELLVFEGLPDPRSEPDLHRREKLRADVISLGGSDFYGRPLALTESELAGLRQLFHPGNPFSPGGGEDPCGKFHPDYVLVWKDKDADYIAQIGLGCQEIHAAGPSLDIHRYIPPDIYARLEKILGKYSVNRPHPGLPR
ncbi:MAG: hypothetical protein WCQ16_11580 [Verrucomicrobiae bacterium]